MPIDITDIKAEYQAQANMNASRLADLATAYPDIVLGAQFYDGNGLKWQFVGIYAFANQNILPIAAWVNDSGTVTDYQQTVYGIMLEKAQYVHNIAFDTVDGQQVYSPSDIAGLSDLIGGTLLSGDIGSAVLDLNSDLTLNPDDGSVTFNIPVAGQHVQLVYKRPTNSIPITT